MDDETERKIFDAKVAEHAAWDQALWHTDSLDDWDDGPIPSLSCYRVDHEPDETQTLIEVVFDDMGNISSYVVFGPESDDPELFSSREAAQARYDELIASVGTVQGWTSSISSPELVAAPSEP